MKNNKRAAQFIIIVLTGTMMMNSCTRKATPEPVASFSKDVVPILLSSCAINGSCHAGATNSGDNLNFDSSSAYNTMISKQLVKTSNPTGSLLYVEINSGVMPKTPYAKLSADRITTILNWIRQGCQNN